MSYQNVHSSELTMVEEKKEEERKNRLQGWKWNRFNNGGKKRGLKRMPKINRDSNNRRKRELKEVAISTTQCRLCMEGRNTQPVDREANPLGFTQLKTGPISLYNYNPTFFFSF